MKEVRCEGYIQTFSGLSFDPMNLSVDSIDVIDIAHSLSLQCRWKGHCTRYFSVAEHSVLMSEVVSKEAALYALLHDLSESFIGDCPRPFKPLFPNFKELEQQIRRTFDLKYGLEIPNKEIIEEIKCADLRMLATERYQNLRYTGIEWEILKDIKPYLICLGYWSPDLAEYRFLARFKELMK